MGGFDGGLWKSRQCCQNNKEFKKQMLCNDFPRTSPHAHANPPTPNTLNQTSGKRSGEWCPE